MSMEKKATRRGRRAVLGGLLAALLMILQAMPAFALTPGGFSSAPGNALSMSGPGAVTGIQVSRIGLPEDTEALVAVEAGEGSSCRVYAYEKVRDEWLLLFASDGVLGRSGISYDRTVGDGTTPAGIFTMNTPFGQKPARPGFPAEYLQVNEDYVWTDDTNLLVKDPARIGEAVGTARYAGYYDYVLDMGYNREGIPEKGSALFLHCNVEGDPSTSGCVAIPEARMISVLQMYARHPAGTCRIAVAPRGSW